MKRFLALLIVLAAVAPAGAQTLLHVADTPEPVALVLTGTGFMSIAFVRKWFSGR